MKVGQNVNDDRFSFSEFFDILLWFHKEQYLTACECTALVYLSSLANAEGRGYVHFIEMSNRFGRVAHCCRKYFHRPKRHGLIEQWRLDHQGGAAFKLLVPPREIDNAAGQQVSRKLVV